MIIETVSLATWHIGVLFRITIDNVRTEGATVWTAAPNPDNRYRSD